MNKGSGSRTVVERRMVRGLCLALALVVGGCSMVRDRPESEDQDVIAPVESGKAEEEAQPEPEPGERDARQRETGSDLSPAAASLLASARGMLSAGDTDRALNLAQRAQRISPDAAEVYFRIGQIYQKRSDHARAEQFVLKGLSKAGNDAELRQTGWSMLGDIRESQGNQAGAEKARERASGL